LENIYNPRMPKEKVEDWQIRKNSLRLKGFDYSARRSNFVTIVTEHRQTFFNDERIAEAAVEVLLNLREKYKFNLYSYCLMPDHFHALIGIGDSEMSLSRICGDFKSLSTRAFWQFYDDKLWQRQFFDHVIRNEQDFLETVEYIRENPVKAKLAADWKDWKYAGEPDLEKFYR
ncbi:MAG TPA: transposase, partial [Pyrinomonadaceae bacterium]|nr:transposase [Pyrinomonadaceae bacterium]